MRTYLAENKNKLKEKHVKNSEQLMNRVPTSFSISDNPGEKMTEVTSRDQEASFISPTTEVKGAWKFIKKL